MGGGLRVAFFAPFPRGRTRRRGPPVPRAHPDDDGPASWAGGAGGHPRAGRRGQVDDGAPVGRRTGLPVIELDALFWRAGPVATPPDEWARVHAELIARPRWIIDGDLGVYDTALSARLARADTVLVLDFSRLRCGWRAARRSRENAEFWRWLLAWQVRSRPAVLRAIATHATTADRHILRTPRQLRRWERKCFAVHDQRRR